MSGATAWSNARAMHYSPGEEQREIPGIRPLLAEGECHQNGVEQCG